MLFSIIYFGSPEVFLLLVLILTFCGILEYNAMSFGRTSAFEKGEGIAAGIILPVAAYFGGIPFIGSATALLFIAAFLLFLGRLKNQDYELAPLYKVLFGMLYVPLMMSHLVLIRCSSNGMAWIFFMIILAFSGDITAFYAGRALGKKKLMAHVSSGKTEAGTIGSMIGSIVGCIIFKLLFLPEITIFQAALLGLLGNIIGELGDLCESVIKRVSGVKDSGFIFPGHGGVLDRLDCILFIAPFLYYTKLLIVR